MKIVDNISETGKNLVFVSRDEVLDKVGQDVMKRIVLSILSGGNVRTLTEGLTRRRLTLSNASLLLAYLNSLQKVKDFKKEPFLTIKDEFLSAKLSKEEKVFLNWMLGLSGKGIQNILRDDDGNIERYLKTIEHELKFAAGKIKEEFGDISANITAQDSEFNLGIDNLLHVFMAIGAQTLTIRGSEKSVYGKLFERLVLGSVLTMLGFEQIDKTDTEKTERVFWLSEQEDKREADATLLVEPGVGARFDIGFIGRGNTEISLDKVSRFERIMERGSETHFMSTIVIVDTIGDGSRIKDLAKEIDGNIIQMSMSNWVSELSDILYDKLDYESDFNEKTEEECLDLLKEKIDTLELNSFI